MRELIAAFALLPLKPIVRRIAFADTRKMQNRSLRSLLSRLTKAKAAKKVEKSEKSDAAIAAKLGALRQALQSQQEQLQMLKEELAKRDRQIDEAREAAAAVNVRAAEANSEAVNTTAEVKATPIPASRPQHRTLNREKRDFPCPSRLATLISCREGSLISLPATGQIKIGSGIGTSFGTIPYSNSLRAARLTERSSAQRTRGFPQALTPNTALKISRAT